MNARAWSIVNACVAFLCPIVALADQVHGGWHYGAIDAQGVRHWRNEYSGRPRYFGDILDVSTPDYPYSERKQYHTGSGLFRLSIDPKTGLVTKVATPESTGFPVLDRCAVDGFRKWRWKPGTWREVDLPITFKLGPWGMSVGSTADR